MVDVTLQANQGKAQSAFRWVPVFAILVLVIASALVFASRAGLLTRSSVVPTSAMRPTTGFSFFVDQFPSRSHLLYGVKTDTEENGQASALVLYENGRSLGPMHSMHTTVRSVGKGAYSFWNNSLVFSTSDGSDPRTNGRVYKVRYPVVVRLVPSLVVWGVTALALLAAGGAMGRRVLPFAKPVVSVVGAVVVPLLVVLSVALSLGAWTRQVDLAPDAIVKDPRGLYVLESVPGVRGFPFAVASDELGEVSDSKLMLFENGMRLGPAHATHSTIQTYGKGSYSHWNGQLLFSTSDGSDPRTNGRTYSIRYPIVLAGPLRALIWLAAACVMYRRRETLLRHGDALLLGLGAAAVAVLVLIKTGMLPPLNESAAPAKDWALIGAIAEHLMIGVGFFAGSAAMSLSFGAAVLRTRPIQPAVAVLIGYPICLPVMLALSILSLTFTGAGWIAAVLALASLVPLALWPLDKAELAALGRTLLRCAAPVCAFAAYTALLLHGPTATLDGVTEGDIAHSAGVIHMMAAHIFPTYHFGSEGDLQSFTNPQTGLIAAAFIWLPNFDAMLFLVCSNAVYYGFWLALGLTAIRMTSAASARTKIALDIALIVLIALVSVRYPTFVIDSPAVSLALPLLFSTSLLAARAQGRLVPSIASVIGVVIGTACSKLVLIIPLTLLAGFDALTELPAQLRAARPKPQHLALVGVVVVAVGLYVLKSVIDWAPVYWHFYEPGPESRLAIVRDHLTDPILLGATIARDVGWVVLGVGVTRLGLRRLTAAYWAAIIAEFVYPYLFYSAALMGMLLVPLALMTMSEVPVRAKRWLWIGAVLLVPFPMLRDFLGQQTAYIYVPCYGALCWLSVGSATQGGTKTKWFSARVPVAVAGAGLLALVAVGGGVIRINGGLNFGPQDVLTSGMYEMWRAVRRETPPDALIFTDLTGPEPRVGSGWNSYASSGERQLYISSWMTSFNNLRIDEKARADRLALNAEVLDGQLDPRKLKLSRHYGSYYAVMRDGEKVPSNFNMVYQNKELALYLIKPSGDRT